MKHAYMIMAHNEFGLLSKLLQMLDYENNDIFLHIDKKATDFCFEEIKCVMKHARLTMVDRLSIAWGDYSQVKAELLLLKAATNSYHDYYHLLSGVDLPIKTHDEIEVFFEQNQGTEFVEFDIPACKERYFDYRLQYYYFDFLQFHSKLSVFNEVIKSKLLDIQKLFGMDRLKKYPYKTMKGSNWFDITHELACYVLDYMQDPTRARIFKFACNADEALVQTILYNSPYLDKCAANDTRFVDWSMGGAHPAVLTMDYWDALCQSEKLYARKFSEKTAPDVVQKVYETFGKGK